MSLEVQNQPSACRAFVSDACAAGRLLCYSRCSYLDEMFATLAAMVKGIHVYGFSWRPLEHWPCKWWTQQAGPEEIDAGFIHGAELGYDAQR